MAIEVINRGTSANDGTGDNIREAFRKVNDNFDQVLTNDTTDYTDATTPLAGTEIALVEQGGTFKKVAVSEFGGGGGAIGFMRFISPNGAPASSQTYYLGGNNLGILASYSTSRALRTIKSPVTGKITRANIIMTAGLSATAPNTLEFYLENVTKGTSILLTNTFNLTGNLNNVIIETDFIVEQNDILTIKLITPSFGSQPTNVNFIVDLIINS